MHHSFLANENLDVRKVALAGLSSGRQPISRVVLGEDRNKLAATRALLEQMLGGKPHASDAIDLCMPREGETLATAFTRAMIKLLGPLGLVVVEPDWIREDLSRALAQVVGSSTLANLERGSAGLREADLEPLIDPATAALVFHVEQSGRRALRPGGEGFRFADEPGSRTGAELASEIVAAPDAYSSGALLRPIVQDLCLPTAAYVGGWAEIEYHAQLLPLRRAVEAPLTPLVPRMSCTLVEPEVQRSLEVLGVDARRALETRGEFEVSDDESDRPAVLDELERVAREASESLTALKPGLAELDRGLAQNAARGARQVRDLIEKLRAKAERVHANSQWARDGDTQDAGCRACSLPRGLLAGARAGPAAVHGRPPRQRAWVDALYEEWPALSSEHLAIHLETGDAAGGPRTEGRGATA